MVPFSKPQKFSSRLGVIQKISSKVYLERFELIEPKEFIFLPGQTVMLQVAPGVNPDSIGVNRSMSVASAPSDKGSILLAHDISPMGAYSKWAMNAKVGDTMNFIGPLGVFTFDRESPRNAVFIATGTGVAPFRSMLLDQLSGAVLGIPSSRNAQGPDLPSVSTVSGAKAVSVAATDMPRRALSLYWGLRHEEDIFWREEFEELAAKHPNFKFVLTLSQPSDHWPASNALRSNAGWQGKRGRVGDHMFIEEKNLTDCDFYLCGNRAMVSEVEASLLANNVPKEHIKKELFY